LWCIPQCPLWRCALALWRCPLVLMGGPGWGWGCPAKAVGAAKAVGVRWISQRRLTAITLFSRVLAERALT
jgi:hypothetical protein